jgi:undecaprenyl-diphosphatase
MNEIIQPIVLGLVQGIGEFLPISSTAHLILVPYFTGWSDPGLSFDVALHAGTLLAVLAYFWKDWLQIFISAWTNTRQNGWNGFKKELLFYLIIGTIPGAFLGFLFEKKAETILRSPLLIAGTLIIVGLILYLADKKSKGEKTTANITLQDSIIIGTAQAFAIIPGVSRSGSTITAGLFRNFKKIDAAKFSFLLSTPIIMGAAVLKLPHLLSNGLTIPLLIGILSSAVSGYLAIKYLLQFLAKYSYKVFFWYRLALGIIIIIFYFLK